MANLGKWRDRTVLEEFTINERPIDIVEKLLAQRPRIIGFGVYIWNATQTLEVVSLIKRINPEIKLVVGGPEVSYEVDCQPLREQVDYLITGEADLTFPKLVQQILDGDEIFKTKVIHAPLPDLAKVQLPYAYYGEDDLAHRIVYVEASRGCPFTCEFCLSSLDNPVRQFDLEPLLTALETLLQKGVRSFKFVDRTFNLNLKSSRRILEFFLQKIDLSLFIHFEMVPDRLPNALRDLIQQFPDGSLQFEVGIQTFNPEVAAQISRRQNYEKLRDNLTFLKQSSGVHVHADLIVGLPGETESSFADGFDQLIDLGPQEIQVGLLKRLKGTPITRHDKAFKMVYSPFPPYELLSNQHLSFETLQRLKRFARYWDLIGNSGNFIETTPLLWQTGKRPFQAFMQLTQWLYDHFQGQHAIALTRLTKGLLQFLTEELAINRDIVRPILLRDYQRTGRSDTPPFLRDLSPTTKPTQTRGARRAQEATALPRRQQRWQKNNPASLNPTPKAP